MHTATRLAVPVIARVRELNPAAAICAFGLYAPLNDRAAARAWRHGTCSGPEFEDDCHARSGAWPRPPQGHDEPRSRRRRAARRRSARPSADGLPPLARYATLRNRRRAPGRRLHGSEPRLQAPLPALPDCAGLRRALPRRPARRGAGRRPRAGRGRRPPHHVRRSRLLQRHRHAMAIVRAVHAEFPGSRTTSRSRSSTCSSRPPAAPSSPTTGCAFVTSAVESVDDEVLEQLEKGHTRADFERAVALCRDAGLSLSPTFVAFTPWTTLDGYCELLQEIDRLELVDARRADPARHPAAGHRRLAPARPPGHRAARAGLRRRDDDVSVASTPIRAVDERAAGAVARLAGDSGSERRAARHSRASGTLAHAAAGLCPPRESPRLAVALPVPIMNEPWYC